MGYLDCALVGLVMGSSLLLMVWETLCWAWLCMAGLCCSLAGLGMSWAGLYSFHVLGRAWHGLFTV